MYHNLFLILLGFYELYAASTEDFDFVGKNNWNNDYLKLCDDRNQGEVWKSSKSICVLKYKNLQISKIEIINWEPALVIYRDFLTPNQVSDFSKVINSKELETQTVVNPDGTREISDHRSVNGFFIDFSATSATTSVFNSMKNTVNEVKFESSEQFSVLSYIPGGHYTPHYDYITYESEEQHDYWMKNFGNRMATFIFVLKTADEGGSTVFPLLNTYVKPNIGDAFFWFNVKSDETLETLSLHGGCPIIKGEKVITTVWIRSKDQSLLENSIEIQSISARNLIS